MTPCDVQKATALLICLTVLALVLCQCASTTEPESNPGLSADETWRTWENNLDLDGGNTFFLDPTNGNLDGDGSTAAPLPGLQVVIDNDLIQRWEAVTHPYVEGAELQLVNPEAPIQPGDTLLLLSGDHGLCNVVESHNEEWITIRAATGHEPVLSGLTLTGVERYRVQDLILRGTSNQEVTRTLLHIESHNWRGPCREIIIERCDIASITDASSWSANDWDQNSAHGVMADGDYITLRDNVLTNVNMGLSACGQYCLIERNSIENFCGDGMRGIGDDMIFEYNTVRNCYDVNDNHDDGFQSFSVNDQPPRRRIILRGNMIIGYTDPDQPFRGTLQGIGCFDGMYDNWIIENNIVATDHWHGITLSGARGCRIVNNTVVDLNEVDPGPPWIRIGPHKDGTPSSNCLIRNNIAASIFAGDGVIEDHNIASTGYDTLFVDYTTLDLRPLTGGAAVDAGCLDLAPGFDAAGTVRPQGGGVDIGAYEL